MNDPWVSFERPAAFALLVAIPVLALLYLSLHLARRRALRIFGGHGGRLVSASLPLQIARNLLRVVGLAALVVAVAGPLLGRPVERWDVVVLMDVSQSMGVQDVTPSRLALARHVVDNLVAHLGGQRMGLVYFAGDARLRFPLTEDTPVIGKVLDHAGYPFVPVTGSSLETGLRAAVELFPPEVRVYGRPKSLVILSDGGGSVGISALGENLRSQDIRVFAVGIGTEDGGRVPLYADNGQFARYLTGADGAAVVSSLDGDQLAALANTTGGRYWTYTGSEGVPQEVPAQILQLPPTEVTGERWVVDEQRRAILLAIALGVLLCEAVLPERRRMPRPAVAQ